MGELSKRGLSLLLCIMPLRILVQRGRVSSAVIILEVSRNLGETLPRTPTGDRKETEERGAGTNFGRKEVEEEGRREL